jgi:hypothetical protein
MRTSAEATAYAMFLESAVTRSTLAGAELDLVARDRRAAAEAGDLGVDLELLLASCRSVCTGIAESPPGHPEGGQRQDDGGRTEDGRNACSQALPEGAGKHEPEAGRHDDADHDEREPGAVTAQLRIQVAHPAPEAAHRATDEPSKPAPQGGKASPERTEDSACSSPRLLGECGGTAWICFRPGEDAEREDAFERLREGEDARVAMCRRVTIRTAVAKHPRRAGHAQKWRQPPAPAPHACPSTVTEASSSGATAWTRPMTVQPLGDGGAQERSPAVHGRRRR